MSGQVSRTEYCNRPASAGERPARRKAHAARRRLPGVWQIPRKPARL